jgi:hypothetical protein
MKKDKNQIANEIIKLLINSGLSVSDQLRVIKLVKQRLDFCKTTGLEMQQLQLL